MRPRPSRRVLAVVTGGALALPVLLAPATAGDLAACDLPDVEVSRVEVRAELTEAGEVAAVRRSVTQSTTDGERCEVEDETDADGLPVAVAVLHSDPVAGSLEPAELATVDGPITTRVAVRDRTARERTVTFAGPDGEDERDHRVGVPHLVRIEVTYPAGWQRIAPQVGEVHTDVVDGGVRIGRSAVLFPPLTDHEVVLPVSADPGRGVPDVAVEVTPLTDAEVAQLALDDGLGRDAAAVVAALTEVGADGAEQLADGTDELAGGLGELADGAGQLASGLGQAAAGGAPLRDGASQLADGTAELAEGTERFASGLTPLADGASQLADGNRELGQQLGSAAEGAEQLADGADQLADGNEQLAAGVEEFSSGLDGFAGGADELRERIAQQLPDLGPITDLIVDALAGPLEELLGGFGELAAGLDQLAAGNRELAAGNRELAAGARELAAGLWSAADGAGELGAGGAQLADGAAEAATAADQLASGTAELADGAGQLSDGLDAYTRGVEEAAGGAGQLAAGTEDAAAGAGQLADGAGQLPEALRQATGTADRHNLRLAEERAIVVLGRELADDAVVAAAGTAPSRTLTTELVAAGDDPPNLAVWLAIAAVVGAGALAGRAWSRSRREVDA